MEKLRSLSNPEWEQQLLFKNVLNSLSDQICVIDNFGTIIYANQSWYSFAKNNGGARALVDAGINYLTVADYAAKQGDLISAKVASGIRSVLKEEIPEFSCEYPCDSPSEKRWFILKIKPLHTTPSEFFVISHHDITARKQAELKIEALTLVDSLTGIPNRRHFLDYAEHEWKRCKREKLPFSIALIDCDNFKLINDNFGHHTGDEVLKAIADSLNNASRRPADLVCRFGGDEFLLAFGGISSNEVKKLLNDTLINISKTLSNDSYSVTLSAGIAQAYPSNDLNLNALIQSSDIAMYQAKKNGKNNIVIRDNVSTKFIQT